MAVYDPLGLEQPPAPRPRLRSVTVSQDGQPADAPEAAREAIDSELVQVTQRVIDHAMGREVMTRDELLAADMLMKRRIPAAATQVNVAQTIEVRDRRREIDAMVDALLTPGAVQRTRAGATLVNLPAVVSEARTARADGVGPPDGVDP
jgi:hypothetical protein